jgi:chromosomal replication initiator protein
LPDERSQTVQQIILRQPREIRAQQHRHAGLAAPLLPVFFAGEENRFAAFVCGASADDQQGDQEVDGFRDALAGMGPVLLVGPSGCGKSAIAHHLAAKLLDFIGDNAAVENSKPLTLVSMPGIDFARLYARAVDSDDITRFRAELQMAPVLVIDDVHLMIDKGAAQDELAARLESRSAASLPTILTCRRLPTQVPGLRPLLVSRMLPGLTVPVRLPGRAAIRMLVTALSQRRDLLLSEEDISLLCGGLPADIPARQIESIVRHLELWCRMKASRPSMIAIREAIASLEPATEISTDKVAKTVARRYKLKLSELKSGTRRQEVVRARSLAMFLSRQLTGTSYDKIGKYFGGRDHTTVLHACRKTESLIENDNELRVAANEVADQLQAAG